MQNPKRYLAKIVDDAFIQIAQQAPEVALHSAIFGEVSVKTPEILVQNNYCEKLWEIVNNKITSGEIQKGQKNNGDEEHDKPGKKVLSM